MSSTLSRYAKAKIYKIINSVDNSFYIGSTCKNLLSQRMVQHREKACYVGNTNLLLYRKMREYGLDKFSIVLIENYPCKSDAELSIREEEIRQELKSDLNVQIAGTRQVKHFYYEDKPLPKSKRKEYYNENKENIKSYQKRYQDSHKEENTKIITCECGARIQNNSKSNHFKSKRHVMYLQSDGQNIIDINIIKKRY